MVNGCLTSGDTSHKFKADVKSVMKHGPGGIKAAMDSLGFFGGDPQSPLKRPSPQGQEDIRKALTAVKEAI